MSNNIKLELYHQLIMDHNKFPKNFKRIENFTNSAEGYNPLCGDHFYVYIFVDGNGKIENISFEGNGCAISKASASIMTTVIKNKTEEEAIKIFDILKELINGNENNATNGLEILEVLKGVSKYPSRIKCASLSWHAMKSALESKKNVSTE
jgi:nitrogen fixation NifU-like protein